MVTPPSLPPWLPTEHDDEFDEEDEDMMYDDDMYAELAELFAQQ